MTITPAVAAYEAKLAAMAALEAQILPRNKAALFDALDAAGIQTVVVQFDGSGDSGQIESIEAYAADHAATELPVETIEIQEVIFDGPTVATEQRTAREAIEIMSYAFLEAVHDGWENDDGAYGEFTFDANERSITLEYNERYTASNYYQHEF